MSTAERAGAYVARVSQKDMKQQFGVDARRLPDGRVIVSTKPRAGRSAETHVFMPVAKVKPGK